MKEDNKNSDLYDNQETTIASQIRDLKNLVPEEQRSNPPDWLQALIYMSYY
jgi:hypothetical protein